jgi:hypothetical protein
MAGYEVVTQDLREEAKLWQEKADRAEPVVHAVRVTRTSPHRRSSWATSRPWVPGWSTPRSRREPVRAVPRVHREVRHGSRHRVQPALEVLDENAVLTIMRSDAEGEQCRASVRELAKKFYAAVQL